MRPLRRGGKWVGRTAGMRRLWWTAREEERRLELAGTKEEPRRPRRTEANSGEMPWLWWARRDEEGLGSCGRV